MLVGLVIISTFIATITITLTASSLSKVKLYGTRVGALHNSEDYHLGVKRNAKVKCKSNFIIIEGHSSLACIINNNKLVNYGLLTFFNIKMFVRNFSTAHWEIKYLFDNTKQ